MSKRAILLLVVAALAAGLGLFASQRYFATPAAAPGPRVTSITLLPDPRTLPAFSLQQSDGTPLAADELKGHWTLVFLGFTHCPDICPTTLAQLAGAQKQWAALPAASRPRVLFVSADPERDSAELTGKYAHAFHADTLAATAPIPQLEAFARSLSLVFMKSPGPSGRPDDYSIDHSAGFAVLDPQARMAGVIQPPFDVNAITADMASLARSTPPPALPCCAREGVKRMSPLTALTYVLPHRALSSLARALAYSTNPSLKQWLIDTVTRKFGVDLSEAAEPDANAYPTFNAFFTRALKPGARVADTDPNAMLMPADGHISQCGEIVDGRIFQAKGQSYTAAELLGSEADAAPFADGVFATVYLSPRDYHRVHMPWTGTLRETVHVPGRLFSVGTDAVASVPRVFARNERLVCHFDTEFGPMVQVMVGALLVSGVETVWSGVEIPAYGDAITRKDYRGKGIKLARFAEMARFNYGSTVIVLLPKGVAELDAMLKAETPVQLGQRLALRG